MLDLHVIKYFDCWLVATLLVLLCWTTESTLREAGLRVLLNSLSALDWKRPLSAETESCYLSR